MVIERIQFKNFQKLRLYRLKLDPHLTMISGESATGKSTAYRGLRWLMLNRGPAKVASHGTKQTSVTMWVDGRRITRSRKGAVNSYALDAKPLKAFGTEVPEPIARLLNVDAVNFQGQFDGPYWFDQTPGQVAKNLNAIVDLGVIDSTLATLIAATRKAKATVDVSRDRLRKAIKDAEDSEFAEQMDTDLQAVEILEERRDAKRAKIDQIEALLEEAREIEETRSRASGAILCGRNAVKTGLDAFQQRQQRMNLGILLSQIDQLSQAAEPPDFGPVKTAMGKWQQIMEAGQQLYGMIEDAIAKANRIDHLNSQIKSLNSELAKVKICPTCKRPLAR